MTSLSLLAGRTVKCFVILRINIIEQKKTFKGAVRLNQKSGRVLDSRPRGCDRVRASPASLRYVLEQDTLIIAANNG